jgi:FAD/FMN-containing dehydrogenase
MGFSSLLGGHDTGGLPPQSQAGSTLQQALSKLFQHNPGAVSYPQDLLYQFKSVKPYNQDIDTTPAAVVRPSNSADVAEVVRCAVASEVKVQARSGGHSYGNYCAANSWSSVDSIIS